MFSLSIYHTIKTPHTTPMPALPNSVPTRANISEVSPQDSATQPSSCLICTLPYSTTPHLTIFNDTTHESPIRLPCGHTFGQHCLGRWVDPTLSHGATRGCPLCRAPLPPLAAPVEAPQRASGLFYFPVFDEGAGGAESSFAVDLAEEVGLLWETDAIDELCELLLVWLGDRKSVV